MSLFFSLPDKDYNYWINSKIYYSIQDIDKFIKYFFPDNIQIEFSNSNSNSNNTKNNTVIYGIQLKDNIKLDTSKLNILICVENCSCSNYTWFQHYNNYKNFNNNKIQIYFYNHIDKCVFTDKYIAIPVIYTQINYFLKYYNNTYNNNNIEPSIYTNFNNKKFCLIATNLSGGETKEVKNKIINKLKKIEECDTLDMYKNEISNKSCYHSIELLNVFNKYKFVFVCENSFGPGYITEKIFNCLFAKCIPIYYGCSSVENYIDKDCFINMNNIYNETYKNINEKNNEKNNKIINLKNK
jgi:hypothetical protein